MGTRSAIVKKTKDGYTGIYCHWDGYPSNNGVLLRDHYQTEDKVSELIALGDLSSLRENANPKGDSHTYDTPEKGVTIAYHRDRGEDFHQVVGATIEEVVSKIDHAYAYVFENGAWTCNGMPLVEAIYGDGE